MKKIDLEFKIDEFTEKSYDLSNIGLDNFYLVIEKQKKYIFSKYQIFWINDKNSFIQSDKEYYLMTEDKKEYLKMSIDQYNEILNLLIF